MSLAKATAILQAIKYIRKGVSAGQWIRDMKDKGLSFRRTDMLAAYRTRLNIEEKKETLQYVRKDYYPSEKHYATVDWKLDREFMYVTRCKVRITPDAPITERIVNIQRDSPRTPLQIQQEVERRWVEREEDYPEELITVTPFLAIRRE